MGVKTANDNYYIKDSDGNCLPLPAGWQNYEKTGWTYHGPVGFTATGFVYLDPEIQGSSNG